MAAKSQVMSKMTDKFTFGSHKGMTFEQVLRVAPTYPLWLHCNSDRFSLGGELLEIAQLACAQAEDDGPKRPRKKSKKKKEDLEDVVDFIERHN